MPLEVIAGRYRVERAVGKGGMGTVWLCHDEVLHRVVAVKQIGVMPGESADDARRAMREARTAAALNHRNAVSIYDVVDHDGAPWLVMEYVPSQTLAQLIAHGPLPAERVARIGAQVAAALASAHALGIIHRDVKPGNILVGEDDLAKISDFGIARIAHDDQLTQTGMMTGTPAYFSPELARGADPGPESDVWALGATLYAAVEGRPAYPKQPNAIATLQAIASESVEHPGRAAFLLDPIGHMMDRDPSSRWTMDQVETALRRLAEERGTTAGAAGAGETTAVFTPAEPDPSTEPESAPASEPEPAPVRRRSRLVPVAIGLAALLLLGLGALFLDNSLGGEDPSAGPTPDGGPAASRAPSQDETPTAEESPTEGPTEQESPTEEPTEQESPTEEPTEQESPTEEPTEQETPDEEETATEDPPVDADAAKVGTVESYFNTVPADLDAGFAQLSPNFQQGTAGGRDTYNGFWSTIEDVEVANVRTAGGKVVLAQVTYTSTDGSTSTENKQYTLVPDGSGYLIDSEEPAG